MPESVITISKELIETTQGPRRFRLRVWVQSTTNNIPGELFVYQLIPAVPGFNDGNPEERFVHIASYADMVAFPKDVASVDSPFFRKHFIDLVHDSRTFLEEKWTLINQQLSILISDITRVNNLPPGILEEAPTSGVCL